MAARDSRDTLDAVQYLLGEEALSAPLPLLLNPSPPQADAPHLNARKLQLLCSLVVCDDSDLDAAAARPWHGDWAARKDARLGQIPKACIAVGAAPAEEQPAEPMLALLESEVRRAEVLMGALREVLDCLRQPELDGRRTLRKADFLARLERLRVSRVQNAYSCSWRLIPSVTTAKGFSIPQSYVCVCLVV